MAQIVVNVIPDIDRFVTMAIFEWIALQNQIDKLAIFQSV